MQNTAQQKEQFKQQLKDQLLTSSELVARLENWAMYYKDRATKQAHCYSIEHRYKSPQIWHPDPIPLPIDEIDAYKIEKALDKLPAFVRISLKGHYVYGGRWHANIYVRKLVCRDLQVHKTRYAEFVDKSEKLLSIQLASR